MTDVTLSALFAGGSEKTETVQVGFGKVNLRHESASYFAGVVTAPFMRKAVTEVGTPVAQSRSASQVSPHPHNGTIYHQKVKLAAGTIVFVTANWTRQSIPSRAGAVFIRLRDTGPVLAVYAKMPQGSDNHISGDKFMALQCRGDVFDAEELKVQGIIVPPHFANGYMDAEELDECYELVEVVAESRPRPAIVRTVTASGETRLVETAVAPQRRIRFGR